MGVQKVSFDDIATSCGNLKNLASALDATSEVTADAVANIKDPTWDGDAARAFADKLKKLVDNLPEANRQLALSVLFLASCADGYEKLGQDSVKQLKDIIGGQEYIDRYDVNSAPTPDLTARIADTYGKEPNKDGDKDGDNTNKDNNNKDNNNNDNNNKGNNNNNNRGGSNNGYNSYSYSTGPGGTGGGSTDITPGIVGGAITGLLSTAMAGQTVELPEDLEQGAYTVTGYDYWIKSGEPMVWAEGTNQRKVADIWKAQGSKFKNGIAVIQVEVDDGKGGKKIEERYLVAVTTKFGQPGDCIDVTLEDGTVIPCIIGDSKGSDAGSEWGHNLSGGKVNVLEFEVQREKYLSSGNPTTAKWGLEWDSNSPVKNIKNNGTIIGAQMKQDGTATTTSGGATGVTA